MRSLCARCALAFYACASIDRQDGVCRGQVEQIEDCSKKLERALGAGAAKDWDHLVIDTAALNLAIADCRGLDWNSEHGASLLETAQVIWKLRSALKESDWSKVESTISAASEIHRAQPELASAQQKLGFRTSVLNLLDQLKPAIESLDLDRLQEVLPLADKFKVGDHQKTSLAIPLVTETIAKARNLYEKGASIRARLTDALGALDFERVKGALDEAVAFGLGTELVRESSEWVRCMDGLSDQLSRAMSNGAMSEYDRDSIQVVPLQEAIANAASAPRGLHLELTVAHSKAQIMLRLRRALKADDWTAVEHALQDMNKLGELGPSVGAEVMRCHGMLAHRQAVVLCQAQLSEAVTSVNEEQLASTTKEAYRLRIRELAPMVTACADALRQLELAEQMSERIRSLVDRLTKAAAVHDVETIASLLGPAAEMRFNGPVIQQARSLLEGVQPMFEQLKQALETELSGPLFTP